ncbi:unnamed protein product, partial [Orchesella dallaii]
MLNPSSSIYIRNILLFCSFMFLLLLDSTISITYEKFTTITTRERAALTKFRGLVSTQLRSQPEYMNDDLFLIRWLRAKNLDAHQAERMLNE